LINWGIFSRFGMLYHEKSGNPAPMLISATWRDWLVHTIMQSSYSNKNALPNWLIT
jgi:hypothetical protein